MRWWAAVEGKKSVLIVTGNKPEVLQLKELLSLCADELELEDADDGLDAFRKLLKAPYDLLLLDFFLPDTDGEELLAKVQRERPGLPVVIIAGRGSEELAAHLLRRGAADYVLRGPAFNHDLLHVIRRNLARVGSERLSAVLSAVAENAPAAAVVVDRGLRVVFANKAARGRAKGELAGRELAGCGLGGRRLEDACHRALEGAPSSLKEADVLPVRLYGRPEFAAVLFRSG